MNAAPDVVSSGCHCVISKVRSGEESSFPGNFPPHLLSLSPYPQTSFMPLSPESLKIKHRVFVFVKEAKTLAPKQLNTNLFFFPLRAEENVRDFPFHTQKT